MSLGNQTLQGPTLLLFCAPNEEQWQDGDRMKNENPANALHLQAKRYLETHPEVKRVFEIFQVSSDSYQKALASLRVRKATEGLASTTQAEWSVTNGGISGTH